MSTKCPLNFWNLRDWDNCRRREGPGREGLPHLEKPSPGSRLRQAQGRTLGPAHLPRPLLRPAGLAGVVSGEQGWKGLQRRPGEGRQGPGGGRGEERRRWKNLSALFSRQSHLVSEGRYARPPCGDSLLRALPAVTASGGEQVRMHLELACSGQRAPRGRPELASQGPGVRRS